MDSDGDDVVFEGHELHKYYERIGFQDFETVKSPTSCEDQICERRHTSPVVRCANVIASLFHSVLNWFRGPWMPTGKLVDINALHTHVQLIVNSGLLYEDDMQFVNNIASSSEDLVMRFTYQTTTDAVSSFPWCCYSLWEMTVFPVAGSVVLHIVLSWNKINKMRERVHQQKILLKVMKELYTVFWKSLKLLQENELILRGFTLARTGSTVSRLEDSDLPCMVRKWYSSPGLRIAVAEHLIRAIKTLSEAVRKLVFYCPLFGQLDNPNHYLSYLDDETLGLLPVDSRAEIKLNDLKRLNQVFLLLQSEFLRRLALCFCPNLWKNNSLKQIADAMKIVNETTDVCSSLQSSLNKEYNVFYTYGVGKMLNPDLPDLSKDLLKTTDSHVAIRSTSLHLQALLLNTRALEEKLQAQKESGEEELEEVMSLLLNIIKELDVCKSCCEEGILQLQKVPSSRQESETQKEIKAPLKTEERNSEVKLIPVGYTDLDPQVEDEVFEAEITENSSEQELDYYDREWTKEERRQREVAKQLSKKMMQELKSVLVVKAEKWKEREAKAMQMKCGKSEPVAATEDEGDKCDDHLDEGKQEITDESKDDPQLLSTESSCTLDIDSQSEVTSRYSSPKRSPLNRLLQDRHSDGRYLDKSTESPASNTSSSSPNVHSSRSPKHVYATETFRPLQNDLKFSVGLYLSNDALAKFQSGNLGTSESFSGMGEKSSSEESLSEVQKSI